MKYNANILSSRAPKRRGDLIKSDRDCPPERLVSSSRAGRGLPRNDIKKKQYNLRKKRGFGLIEVMVALTIMIIVIGATGATTRLSLGSAQSAQQSLVAAGLAQAMLENARFTRDKDPASGPKITLDQQYSLNNVVYKQSIDIKDETSDQLGGGHYWLVNATVAWRDKSTNQNRQYTLSTILRR